MAGAPTPQLLLEAIAADAGAGFINAPMPEAPTGTLAASIQGGFPPLVMTDVNAGGKPPLGQDINGFLFLITSHTLWVECGQLYPFNATLAAQIGGYLAGTILGMADGTGMWLNISTGNTTNPDAGGAGWVPMACYGRAAVTGLTGGTVALTAAQAKFGVIVLTGALTSNLTIQFPATIQEWLVINGTTGAFTTTLKTAAGGSVGVAISQGGFSAPLGIYSIGDGNIYPTVAPLSIPISQNADALTIAERTNTGNLLAQYFITTAVVENLTAAVVYTDTGNGQMRRNTLTNFEGQMLLSGLSGQVTNGQVPFSVVSQWATALFASAALTGTPTAPTAAAGTRSTQIASTAFANPVVTTAGSGICITFANNYKLQFGSVNPAGGTALFTFPVPFTAVPVVVPGQMSGGATQAWVVSGSLNVNNVQIANSGGSSFVIAVGI